MILFIRRLIFVLTALVSFYGVAYPDNLPLPAGQQAWTYPARTSPSKSPLPANSFPVAFGPVAAAGNTVNLQISLDPVAGPVDIYLALFVPEIAPEIFLLRADGTLRDMAEGFFPWMENVSAGMEFATGDIPIRVLASGTYYFGLLVTPHLDAGRYYLWITSFSRSNMAFVTSVTGNGNLGSWADAGGATGVAAGDAICQTRANAAGIAGNFKAWLSDDQDDAFCRVHNLTGKKSANCGQAAPPQPAGPWIRTDGFPFGEDIVKIHAEGKVYAPVRYDEFGNSVPTGRAYYTGTSFEAGTVLAENTCANWTSSGESLLYTAGTSSGTTEAWSQYIGGSDCGTIYSLLCLQAGPGTALPSFSSTGKKVFVTSARGNGNLGNWADAAGQRGTAAGDAICRARAAAAGLAGDNRYKALLSDGSTDLKDRIVSDGPWVRLDGVKVAQTKADLLGGSLFSPINVTETNLYLGYGDWAWTGSTTQGVKAGARCGEWSGDLSTSNGQAGSVPDASAWWVEFTPITCDRLLFLYCLED